MIINPRIYDGHPVAITNFCSCKTPRLHAINCDAWRARISPMRLARSRDGPEALPYGSSSAHLQQDGRMTRVVLNGRAGLRELRRGEVVTGAQHSMACSSTYSSDGPRIPRILFLRGFPVHPSVFCIVNSESVSSVRPKSWANTCFMRLVNNRGFELNPRTIKTSTCRLLPAGGGSASLDRLSVAVPER